MVGSVFEKEYFKSGSTYKKFESTDSAVSGLSNYYFGLYQLISEYLNKTTSSSTRVLEVGCGYSGLINHFLSDSYSYTGLDISNFIVNELQQKYPESTFIKHDIQYLLDSSLKFDLVVGMEMLEHIANPLEALRNIYSVLNNDGLFIATVPNPKSKIPFTDWRKDPTHVSIMSKGEWVSLFGQAGFKSIRSTTIFSLPYIWRFGKKFSKFYTTNNIGASILLIGRK